MLVSLDTKPDFKPLLHESVSENTIQTSSMEGTKACEFENAQRGNEKQELRAEHLPAPVPATVSSAPQQPKNEPNFFRPQVGRSRTSRFITQPNGSPVLRHTKLYINPALGSPPEFRPRKLVADPVVSMAPESFGPDEIRRFFFNPNRYAPVGGLSAKPQVLTSMPSLSVTPNNQDIFYNLADHLVNKYIQPHQDMTAQNQMTSWLPAPLQMPAVPTERVSHHLSLIAPCGVKPNIHVACDPQNFPFVELLRRAEPVTGQGVVRITNIPYGTSRSEIIALLGRNAMLLDDKLEPVHIIMDRITGKTLEAYVEFKSVFEAVKAVDRQIEVHRDGNKGGRLGKRFVVVEVSGPEQMMRALFPKAVNVIWHGMIPEIYPPDPRDKYNTGFKGFIMSEELIMLVKHIQEPARVHFSEKCHQRPFECMISTIARYPWYMVDHITIGDRDEIFYAAMEILRCLLMRMSEEDLLLNRRLLKRLTDVMFSCPGFTDAQKDDVCFICNINPYSLRPALAPMADHWHVFKTICAKPYVETDVLKYYIALLREATTSMDVVTLADRASTGPNILPPFFGNIKITYPPDVKHWTFSQVARIEWDVVDNLLRQVLGN